MDEDKEVKPTNGPDESQKINRSSEDNEPGKNDTPSNTANSTSSERSIQEEAPKPEDTPENANTEGIP